MMVTLDHDAIENINDHNIFKGISHVANLAPEIVRGWVNNEPLLNKLKEKELTYLKTHWETLLQKLNLTTKEVNQSYLHERVSQPIE